MKLNQQHNKKNKRKRFCKNEEAARTKKKQAHRRVPSLLLLPIGEDPEKIKKKQAHRRASLYFFLQVISMKSQEKRLTSTQASSPSFKFNHSSLIRFIFFFFFCFWLNFFLSKLPRALIPTVGIRSLTCSDRQGPQQLAVVRYFSTFLSLILFLIVSRSFT